MLSSTKKQRICGEMAQPPSVPSGTSSTKFLQPIEPTAISIPTRSIERRIRKMIHEEFPTKFAFCVQARALCVGVSIVYRVEITIKSSTTSVLSQRPTSSGGQECQSWMIPITHVKFHKFFSQVEEILRQPTVTQYLSQKDNGWRPFKTFMCLLSDVFDRFQCLQHAFAIQADASTVNDNKVALEAFLTECWEFVQMVAPVLGLQSTLPEPIGREISTIYGLLRDFLAYPEVLFAVNCTYANAIMSLEDTNELQYAQCERACSICLETLTQADQNAGQSMSSASFTTSQEPAPSDAECSTSPSEFPVKLPCAHFFHEKCVMTWLHHNPTCPECRSAVKVRSTQS